MTLAEPRGFRRAPPDMERPLTPEVAWQVLCRAVAAAITGADRNHGVCDNAGHVRVFKYSSGSGRWSQVGSDMDGAASVDLSRRFVSLWGPILTDRPGEHHLAW
jgi:hypothetical protein